ncbi:MAG: divergent polysaccharide deacetylase family protein, partial [Methylocapsa sp.]|nr:divergent polysaccharide deacetylase family protein [Methylocapsa sp.]
GPGTEEIANLGGVKIVRAGSQGTSQPLVIDVAKELNRGSVSAADPRLLEQTRYGSIPRMGADGTRPSKAYARPAYPPGEQANFPRIALVVGGMGLASHITQSAISALPPAVTLAFAPYGSEVRRLSALARESGHEILLQVPMEPFNSHESSGPRTLLTSAGKAANLDNLAWLMSRFTGYTGITNFLGGKFTGDEKALMPVLREIAARGLLYLDDGSLSQTNAAALAPYAGVAATRADIVLDSVPQPEAVEGALKRLEVIAREKGTAIGVASALPVSIAAIGRYTRGLQTRGFSLIPLSAAIPSQQDNVADSSPAK